MNLPIYQLTLSAENDGVEYVALVDSPAIRQDWIAMKEQPEQYKLKLVNEEKRIVAGALMIPDMPIYRMNEKLGEHFVIFTKETIEKIRDKFHRLGNNANVNLMHDPNQKVDNCFMISDFIIDSEKGIAPMKGTEHLADGTWFSFYKVENDSVWETVKDGTFKGFSVEGLFTYSDTPYEAEVSEFLSTIKKTDLYSLYLLIESEQMTAKELIEKAKLTFKSTPQKFMEVKTQDGIAITIDGDAPAVGAAIRIGDAVAPDGDYILEDGSTVSVLGGKISELATKAAEVGEGEDMKKLMASMEERLKSLETKNIEMEAAHKTATESATTANAAVTKMASENIELKTTVETLTTQLKETFAVVEAIANEEVVVDNSANIQFKKKEAKNSRLEKLAEINSKLNKS